MAQKLFEAVGGQAREKNPLSDEHFSVDGTLLEAWARLEAWASKKSYQKKEEPPPDQGKWESRRAAVARYACLHHRPGCADVLQECGLGV